MQSARRVLLKMLLTQSQPTPQRQRPRQRPRLQGEQDCESDRAKRRKCSASNKRVIGGFTDLFCAE
jgi:hypothetical protein